MKRAACMAVGRAVPPYANKPYQNVTLAEAWDGTSWTLGSPLDPLSATQSGLNGVSCLSPGICTAVGSWDSWTPATTGFYPLFTLAERYS